MPINELKIVIHTSRTEITAALIKLTIKVKRNTEIIEAQSTIPYTKNPSSRDMYNNPQRPTKANLIKTYPRCQLRKEDTNPTKS